MGEIIRVTSWPECQRGRKGSGRGLKQRKHADAGREMFGVGVLEALDWGTEDLFFLGLNHPQVFFQLATDGDQ